jgi:hypothetical protein
MPQPERKVRVDTWEAGEQRLLQIEKANSKSLTGVWFRGQSDASWGLKTTLERYTNHVFSIDEYRDLTLRIKPILEATTGGSWETSDWSDPSWPIDIFFRKVMNYDYLVYLRHHGFPSPLLDWSLSPYVAAHFAFAHAKPDRDVAIYTYSEMPHNIKSSNSKGPKIVTHGGYNLKTHKRHYQQQSAYTVCLEEDQSTQRWQFVSHERIFDLAKAGPAEQDTLYETIIPGNERVKVLKHLDRFNLNAYSLFGSDESLLDTLAFREIDLKHQPKTDASPTQ